MQHDLVIFGAGGLGREVAMLVAQINREHPQWNLIGFFDDRDLTGHTISGLPWLGNPDALNRWETPVYVALAIGDPAAKQSLANRLTNPLIVYPLLCHPDSVPHPDQQVAIGEGTIICQGVILTVDITIGKHVLLNLATTVGHDARIGHFCSAMPGVRISGETVLEEGVYLGTNASVLNRVTIGSYAKIGAGAVVTKSVPGRVTAVGVPAEIIKQTS